MPPTFAEARIDLSAIAENIRLLAGKAPGAEVMAVVKADGYGHGMLPAARAMKAGGASWFGTAFIEEALELRANGITEPAVAWILPPGAPLGDAVDAGIDLGVSDPAVLARVVGAARGRGRAARVHLKADTGLNRGGVTAPDWPAVVAAAAAAEASGEIAVTGVFSHFACADEPGHPSIAAQSAVFTEALDIAEKAGLRPQVRHFANSAATLTLPDAHYDLVRPGMAAYGLCPIPGMEVPGLRPAMTLRSRIALVKGVPAGVGVSYGHRYHTASATRLALIPLGYADGVPRAATNRGPVRVAGEVRTISGTVCMDQFMVDIGEAPAEAGEYAVLFGGEAGEPTANDWAAVLDTIPYEIVTRVGPRVPRTYVGGPGGV